MDGFFLIIAEFKTLCPDGYGRVVDPSGGIVGKVILNFTKRNILWIPLKWKVHRHFKVQNI